MSTLDTGAQRLYLIGTIKVTSPLHIGSGETAPRANRPDTDRPVQLDADGLPYLPATALGGLLRNTAENLVATLEGWSIEDVINLFGAARPEGQDTKGLHPSRLRLRHATLKDRAGLKNRTEVRDGVGIDRQRAAARSAVLYNYEVVPANTQFELCLELRDGSERDKALLALTLEALQQLPSAIGGKVGSGFGNLQLGLEKVVEVDLTCRDTLLRFLRQGQAFDPFQETGQEWEIWRSQALPGGARRKSGDSAPPAWRIPQAVTFTYELVVEDPVLIRGRNAPEAALQDFSERRGVQFGEETKGIDASWIGRWLLAERVSRWEPFLPGPSLRGVFRSHCERILRTLTWHYVGGAEDKYEEKVAASDPLEHSGYLRSSGFAMQNDLKQLAERVSTEGDERKRHQNSRRLAEEVWGRSDPGERMWGSSQWKSRVMVSEATVVGDWQEALFDHVAINRFTGGAADQKLFNALAISRAKFRGTITVFGDEIWMLGLIALLFKDLHDGLIRIGSGKMRGYGKVQGRLTKIEVKALPGSGVAEMCGLEDGPSPPVPSPETAIEGRGKVWAVMERENLSEGGFLAGLGDADPVRKLLEQGVCQLQEVVEGYQRSEGPSGT